MVILTFHLKKNFLLVLTDIQKYAKSYYGKTSHDYFCHYLFANHNILSGIFIPFANSCDLPVFDQIYLFFSRKNLKSLGFEHFWLTGLHCQSSSCLSHFAPKGDLGLTLGSVFACHFLKRGDQVSYTQSTVTLLINNFLLISNFFDATNISNKILLLSK